MDVLAGTRWEAWSRDAARAAFANCETGDTPQEERAAASGGAEPSRAPAGGLEAQDEVSNRHLLHLLRDVPDDARTARYVCAAALAWPHGRTLVRTGTCGGVILRAPRGAGGFGYDPLFYVEEEGMTFGELPAPRKNALSHRGRAVRAMAAALAGVDENGAIV